MPSICSHPPPPQKKLTNLKKLNIQLIPPVKKSQRGLWFWTGTFFEVSRNKSEAIFGMEKLWSNKKNYFLARLRCDSYFICTLFPDFLPNNFPGGVILRFLSLEWYRLFFINSIICSEQFKFFKASFKCFDTQIPTNT